MLLTTNLAAPLVRFIGNKDADADGLEYRISGKIDLASAWFTRSRSATRASYPSH